MGVIVIDKNTTYYVLKAYIKELKRKYPNYLSELEPIGQQIESLYISSRQKGYETKDVMVIYNRLKEIEEENTSFSQRYRVNSTKSADDEKDITYLGSEVEESVIGIYAVLQEPRKPR